VIPKFFFDWGIIAFYLTGLGITPDSSNSNWNEVWETELIDPTHYDLEGILLLGLIPPTGLLLSSLFCKLVSSLSLAH